MLASQNSRSGGVTLIEILLVISIVLLLGVVVSPFLTNFVVRNNFDTTSDKVISSIRKAQGFAIDNKDGAVWGVCLTSGSIRMYSGNCTAPTKNEDYSIPSSVSVSGLNDTTFSPHRGELSSPMTITITSDIDTQTIEVNTVGGMMVN